MLTEKDLETLIEGSIDSGDFQIFLHSRINALNNRTPHDCLQTQEGQLLLQGMLNELGLFKGMA